MICCDIDDIALGLKECVVDIVVEQTLQYTQEYPVTFII